MNKNISFPILFLSLIFFFISIGSLMGKDNEVHQLKWNKVEGSSKYLIEVKSDFDIIFSEETKQNSIKLYLPAGSYLYRVTVFDFFNKPAGTTPWVKMTIGKSKKTLSSNSKTTLPGKAGITLLLEYMPTIIGGFPEPYPSGLSFLNGGFSMQWDVGKVLTPKVPILNQIGTEFFFSSSYIQDNDDDNSNKIILTQYGLTMYLRIPFTDYFNVLFGGGFTGTFIFASSESVNNNYNTMIFQPGMISYFDMQFIVSKSWVITANCNILYSPGDDKSNSSIIQIQLGIGTGIRL